jgi:hypothetical protein
MFSTGCEVFEGYISNFSLGAVDGRNQLSMILMDRPTLQAFQNTLKEKLIARIALNLRRSEVRGIR